MRTRTLNVLVLLLIMGASGRMAVAQELYQRSFGKPGDPAFVFLHGGPGYNSASFELGAAEALAARGYHVVVYDRRGTARSKVKKAKYTFTEAEKDLLKVMKKNKLRHAGLIGHSFGGALAIRFATHHPEMVDNVVLVGAPMDYPATFETIRRACRAYYTAQSDSANLRYMDVLDTMDTGRLDYAVYCFAHAMACKLYQPDQLSGEAREIYRQMATDPQSKYLALSKRDPVKGFHDSHRYTTLDFSGELKSLTARKPVYGIFGAGDGLFDAGSLAVIEDMLGPDHFFLVRGASHSVFIDQRKEFLDILDRLKP